jgi:hypothetical protein
LRAIAGLHGTKGLKAATSMYAMPVSASSPSPVPMQTPSPATAPTTWESILHQGTAIPAVGHAPGSGIGIAASRNEESVRLMSKLLGEWRQIAVGRLTAALKPLPVVPGMLVDASAVDKNLDATPDSAKIAMARRIYRDARQMRASIRVVNIKDHKTTVTYRPLQASQGNGTSGENTLFSKNGKEISITKLDEYRKALLCM